MYGPSTQCQANGLGGAYVNNIYSLGTQDAYVPPPVVVQPPVAVAVEEPKKKRVVTKKKEA